MESLADSFCKHVYLNDADNRAFHFAENIHAFQHRLESNLKYYLNLTKVPAPILVTESSGLQDPLNGETPLSFQHPQFGDEKIQIVHSLAKWKRQALRKYTCNPNYGIYTVMNAIRPQEHVDQTHSLYVDQFDWEVAIAPEQRTRQTSYDYANLVWKALVDAKTAVPYNRCYEVLPSKLYSISTDELYEMYPNLTPTEREHEICKVHGAVYLQGIGYPLKNMKPHDNRAPDYDDWSTLCEHGYHGMNGDIIVWAPALNTSLELSSMGVRVDAAALRKQFEIQGKKLQENPYTLGITSGAYPFSVGGGIGISRATMWALQRPHIADVQASVWPTPIPFIGE